MNDQLPARRAGCQQTLVMACNVFVGGLCDRTRAHPGYTGQKLLPLFSKYSAGPTVSEGRWPCKFWSSNYCYYLAIKTFRE